MKKKSDFYSNSDSIELIYDIKKDHNIRIISNHFINRHNKVCKIIYNYKEYPLTEYFNLDNISYEDIIRKKITTTLKGLNLITDMSYMFQDCNELQKVFLSNVNMSQITSLESMFENCHNLEEISDTSLWNVEKVESMKHLFYCCTKLKYIPGIENWNPLNLTTCEKMFQFCDSLSTDEKEKIYNWNKVSKKIKDEAYSNLTHYANMGVNAFGILKNVASRIFN